MKLFRLRKILASTVLFLGTFCRPGFGPFSSAWPFRFGIMGSLIPIMPYDTIYSCFCWVLGLFTLSVPHTLPHFCSHLGCGRFLAWAGFPRARSSTRELPWPFPALGSPPGDFPGCRGVSARFGSPLASYGQISGLADRAGRLVDAGAGVGL